MFLSLRNNYVYVRTRYYNINYLNYFKDRFFFLIFKDYFGILKFFFIEGNNSNFTIACLK